jgi:hypothetical protein
MPDQPVSLAIGDFDASGLTMVYLAGRLLP